MISGQHILPRLQIHDSAAATTMLTILQHVLAHFTNCFISGGAVAMAFASLDPWRDQVSRESRKLVAENAVKQKVGPICGNPPPKGNENA